MTSTLQTVQNKVIKLLLNLNWQSSTNYIHKYLHILKISDIYKVAILEFVHDCHNNRTPSTFQNYFQQGQTHYNTRQTGNLRPNYARLTLGSTCVKNQGARLWNEIHHVTRGMDNRKQFKKSIAKDIILNYNACLFV